MSWFHSLPLGLLALLIALLLLAALEIGHRLSQVAPITEQQVSTISTAILAVVGLLLAFSFGMAGDRHALRRAAAVQGANSIGTFWLRTSLEPEPIRTEMRSRLRRYVDLHIEHRKAGIDQRTTTELEAEADRLERDIWALLEQDAERAPESSRLRLLVPALNAMIDDRATLQAARNNRVPTALLVYLLALVCAAGVVTGYRPRRERRNSILWGIFLLVVGGALMVLLDIDRTRSGFVQTDPTPYVRLRSGLD